MLKSRLISEICIIEKIKVKKGFSGLVGLNGRCHVVSEQQLADSVQRILLMVSDFTKQNGKLLVLVDDEAIREEIMVETQDCKNVNIFPIWNFSSVNNFDELADIIFKTNKKVNLTSNDKLMVIIFAEHNTTTKMLERLKQYLFLTVVFVDSPITLENSYLPVYQIILGSNQLPAIINLVCNVIKKAYSTIL